MKKQTRLTFYLVIVSLSFLVEANAQDSLSIEVVKKFSYVLQLEDGKLKGAGWDSLRSEITKSQFVLIGENHASPKLSELLTAMLPEAKKLGFHHFITETGPIASNKLKQLYDSDVNVFQRKLYDFATTYKLAIGSPPAEFMVMKKDAAMYKAAIDAGVNIQGIDREYYSSSKYLFAELKNFCQTKELISLFEKANNKLNEYIAEDIKNKSTSAHILKCQSDADIQLFLNKISTVNDGAKEIVTQIRKCHEVYGLYANKKYRKSEDTRVANYKKNFGNYYYKNQNGQIPFKAFIKMGNIHTGKGENDNGYWDIGNMIYQLAAMNGTRSLHIENMRRYRYDENGAVLDFLNDGYEVYPNLINQTDKNNWVIVNLNTLYRYMVLNKIKVNRHEMEIIKNNDWLLLTPLDDAYESSLNYD
jgi:hypothetical protein